jgi:hypothetical protein
MSLRHYLFIQDLRELVKIEEDSDLLASMEMVDKLCSFITIQS